MRSSPTREEIFERFISERRLKATWQRSLIVNTFFGLSGHLSVEELWGKIRNEDPRVSVATVYRTMKLLAQSGLAHARNFGDGQTRYEAAVGRENHNHLICTDCNRIIEFENEAIERFQEAVARKHGFHKRSHKMEIYGLCGDCVSREGA